MAVFCRASPAAAKPAHLAGGGVDGALPRAGASFYTSRPRPAPCSPCIWPTPPLPGARRAAFCSACWRCLSWTRAKRSRADVLVDAAVSPLCMALVRLLALLAAAVLTLGLTMLLWLPISRALIGSVFGGTDYVLGYALLMGLALPLGGIVCRSGLPVHPPGGSFAGAVWGLCRAEPYRVGKRLAALLAQPQRVGAFRRFFPTSASSARWPICA